jgi:hypothetical protein
VKIKDVQVGSVIKVPNYSIEKCLCLGEFLDETGPNYVLVGFRPGEPSTYCFPIHDNTKEGRPARKALEDNGCDRAYYLDDDERVLILSEPIHNFHSSTGNKDPGGVVCDVCQNFSPFSVPNRCNGTKFVCFSCRTDSWVPPSLRV